MVPGLRCGVLHLFWSAAGAPCCQIDAVAMGQMNQQIPGMLDASDPAWQELPRPRACQQPLPLLRVLCGNAPHALLLLHLGIRLLGERGLWRVANASTTTSFQLASSQLTVWHHLSDSSVPATIAEQQADVYGLRRVCRNISSSDWLVDVGANIGVAALHMLLRTSRTGPSLIAVEPSPQNYFFLLVNLFENAPGHRVVAYRSSVASTIRPASGWHNDHLSSMSAVTGRAPLEGSFSGSSVRLEALLGQTGVSKVALLKLDCEGCEWEVGLEIAHRRLGRRLGHIVGELHFPCLVNGEAKVDMRQCLAAAAPHLDLADAADAFHTLCHEFSIETFKCRFTRLGWS